MPILLHAFNNLISAIMMLYSDAENFSGILKISKEQVLGIGIVVFAVPFYFFAIRRNIIYKN